MFILDLVSHFFYFFTDFIIYLTLHSEAILSIHALWRYMHWFCTFFFRSFLNGHFNISFHTAFNRNNRWTDNIVYSVCIAFAWNKKTMREYFAFLNKMIVKMIFYEAYWISSNRLSTFIYHVVKIECISHVQIYVRQCC